MPLFHQGIMLVYDVTRRSTFEALEKWMHEISLVKKSYLDVLHTRLYLIVSDSSRIYQKKNNKKKNKTKTKQQQKKKKQKANNNKKTKKPRKQQQQQINKQKRNKRKDNLET